jgi:hypothetical protein
LYAESSENKDSASASVVAAVSGKAMAAASGLNGCINRGGCGSFVVRGGVSELWTWTTMLSVDCANETDRGDSISGTGNGALGKSSSLEGAVGGAKYAA